MKAEEYHSEEINKLSEKITPYEQLEIDAKMLYEALEAADDKIEKQAMKIRELKEQVKLNYCQPCFDKLNKN